LAGDAPFALRLTLRISVTYFLRFHFLPFVNGRAVWIAVLSPYGKDSNFVSVGGSKLGNWNGLSARKRFKFDIRHSISALSTPLFPSAKRCAGWHNQA
jgi:hypothetical protein